jgi:2',3'-cyclic-nucleotide 2'-phosphodiesterase
MKLLFIGDVMGEPGLRAVRAQVPRLREHYRLDLVIANAENVAGGNGVTPQTAQALFDAGVDLLTNGNHAWDKREALDYIRGEPRLLRPYNYPDGTPGTGWLIATAANGHKIGVLNLLGTTFMEPRLTCAFRSADRALEGKPEDLKLVFVDMHAETTSEKMALAWYLDGRVSAVIGTHTHVPTADERILPKGTGFLTDVGMSGCYDSVIGLKVEQSLERFVNKLPARFEVAQGEGELCAVLLDLDEASGRCRYIERVRLKESEVSTPSLRRVV